MTTNAKYNRYVELGETFGIFIKRAGRLVVDYFRPTWPWGDRYSKPRNGPGQHWPK